MQLIRAHELLMAIDAYQEVDMTPEEQEELRLRRVINVVQSDEQRSLSAEVREIDFLTQSVRQQIRAGAPPAAGALDRFEPSAQRTEFRDENLQEKLARLEDLIGKKALLDSLAFSRGTNSYVALTVTGRKTLADLRIWMPRFSQSTFEDFLAKMDTMRDSMVKAVVGAQIYMQLYESPDPDMLEAELRGPALLASMRGTGPDTFVEVMRRSPQYGGGGPPGDEMLDSMDESSDDEDFWSDSEYSEGSDETDFYTEYSPPKIDLESEGLPSSEEEIKEATLAGLPPEATATRLERMNWIRANLALPDDGVIAWLAASPYAAEEVKSRYDQIMQTLNSLGYPEEAELRSAVAILAGSPYSVQECSSRFADLAGELKGVYEKPFVAAAMLAANSFTPLESMDIFREAVGVISRSNYFDDVGEIETLALLLTNKVTPDLFLSAQGATPVATQSLSLPVQQQPADYQDRRVSWNYWYYWNSRYYHRPLIYNVRTHPGHMHTVPYFG